MQKSTRKIDSSSKDYDYILIGDFNSDYNEIKLLKNKKIK